MYDSHSQAGDQNIDDLIQRTNKQTLDNLWKPIPMND